MEMRVSKDKLAVAAEQNVTERDYWQNLLSGEGDFIKSTFPYDYQEKKPGEYSPDRLKFHFSPGLFSKVMELSKGVEVKLHMLLVTGLFILLNKYMSGNKDIMIGSPILKQDIEGEFINTVLVFRTPVEDHASFKELLLQIRETIIKANENQNYPLELLLERLDIPEREEKFSLFDVGLLLENIHDKRYLQGIDYSMLFSFLKTREHIKGVVEYNSLLYRQDTVKRIISHYMRVMEQGLEDVNQKLTHLQLLSETERQQVLVDFNNTKVQYPQDRVLDELFEEQVESTPNHVAVVGQNSSSGVGTRFVTSVTYKELNRQSNQLADLLRKKGIKPDTIVGIIVEPSLEMMVGILGILKAGGAYLPLDLDYPEERIRYMLRDANVKFLVTTPDLGEKFDKLLIVNCELLMVNEKHPYGRRPNNPPQETINNLQLKHASLAYIIYTSGSTGKPKGVMVEHGNVVCYLNAFYLEFNIQAMDTGIQLAPFSFDVYIEEMFPILLKGGRFIIPDASRMMDMDWLTRLIVKHGVSIIDCTPLLLNEINKCELETTEITFISGGDVLKKEYIDKLLKVGPVYNTYGPTETTVCASYFQCNRSGPDMIPPIPIGKPIANYNIYILDSYHQPVPIGVCGELFISGPGVTRGYLNQPELTAEKFVLAHNSRLTAERETMKAAINYNYKTGDLGRWLSDGNIQFLNRKDLQVKIRGYRVETAEIEKRLLVHAGIKEVVVVAREDSDGDRYLCAYIIPAGEIEFSGLKESLASELPHYMIPSFFVSMSQLPLTSTGKIDRKALPEPKIDARAAYVHPQNQIQKQMQKIWQKVLGLESIGIYDNFFNIGGHSLKGIQVINGIHREFNVKIPLAEMFRTPTIKGLSGYIETTAKDKFVSLEPVEEKEYYALSSAQKRLYILQELESESTAYNMPQVTTVKLKIEKGKPEQSFRKLIHRHESLRTSFDMINQQPVQRIYPSRQLEFEIKYFDLPGTQVEVKVKVEEEAAPCGHVLNAFAGHYPRSQELRVKSIISSFIRPFDLRQAPLLRVGIIKTGEKKYILMTDMHHIVSDGVSYGILTGDFIRLYLGEDLAPLRLQYKDFSEWQQCEKQKELTKQQELYWMKIFSGQLPLLNLPIDYPRPLLQSFEGSSVSFALNEKEVRTLKEINKETGTTLYMFILAIYNILLCKLSGQEDIIIGTPIAARRHKELERVIGMFANTLAMRNYPWGEKSFNQFLIEVKERTLEAFENQEYPFEELVEKVWAARDTSRNPLFDVMLVMQNLQQPESTTDLLAAEALPKQSDRYQHESSISKFDLTLTAREAGNTLHFSIEYCTKLFKSQTIEGFLRYMKNLFSLVCRSPGQRIAELEILTSREKKQLLEDFNCTRSNYPKDKRIDQLFERQATATPHHIAVGFHRQFITYEALNIRARTLAASLYDRGVRPDSIAAIMQEPSLEMIVGVLAILKAGGAYLPINPGYPGERIKYMLEDSSAGILLSTPDLSAGITFAKKILHAADAINRVPTPHLHLIPAPVTSLAYIMYTSGSTGTPRGVMVEHGSVVRLVMNTNYLQFRKNDRLLQTGALEFDASTFEIWGTLLNGLQLYLESPVRLLNPGTLKESIEKNRINIMWMTAPLFNRMVDADPEIFRGLNTLLVGGDKLSPRHIEHLRQGVAGIHIINGYGPTENTTFSTTFLIQREYKENIPIGKPIANSTAIIIDSSNHLAPIGVIGELCVGGDGLARGYLNDPELTAEKFVLAHSSWLIADRETTKPVVKFPMSYQLSAISYIYKTGDLARWLLDGTIEFFGRIDHQVKIRGFRVEPGEIENQLRCDQDINEAVVLHKENPGGEKYLVAYIVGKKEVDVPELLTRMSRKLPGYMVPSYVIPVERIPLTTNGKVDRQRLPEPGWETAALSSSPYAAPINETEKELTIIWATVLGIKREKISIDADFFQLGGHSLKAIILLAKIQKQLNVKIPLAEIFRTPTIKDLSAYIRKTGRDRYASIESVEKKDYYPLSPAQNRLYIIQQMDLTSTAYNMPEIIELRETRWGEPDPERLVKGFIKLIQRHESLRTSFMMMDDEPVQRVHDKVEFEIGYYHMKKVEEEWSRVRRNNLEGTRGLAPWPDESVSRMPHPAAALISSFIRPFDLTRAPLLRVGLLELPYTPTTPGGHPHGGTNTGQDGKERQYILMVDMHHIISDGISHRILVTDFINLYKNEALNPLRIHYKDFSRWQTSEKEKKNIKPQETYWLSRYAGEIPVLNLPTDYSRPAIQSFTGSAVSFEIPAHHTAALKKIALEEGCTLYMLLLALTNILLSKFTNQEDIVIGTPVAGRRHADLHQIIGMFVNTLALRNHPRGEKSFKEFLSGLKKSTLDAFENQEYPFEDLVDRVGVNRDTARNPLFDVMLVLQSFDDQSGPSPRAEVRQSFQWHDNIRRNAKFDITLIAAEAGESVSIYLEYCVKLFKKKTIKRLINCLNRINSIITANPGIKIWQIEIISAEEKEKILSDFNATHREYPGNKTIHQLFEKQAEHTPERIALVGKDKGEKGRRLEGGGHLTYKELNEKANHLVCPLKEKGVGYDTIVGIMVERSIEMVVGILAILKAGGAYLPLDPEYPGERIKYMLEDSSAAIVLTTLDLSGEITFGKEILHLTDAINRVPTPHLHLTPLPVTSLAYIIYTSGSTGLAKGVMVKHQNVVRLVKNTDYITFRETDRILPTGGLAFDASTFEIWGALLNGPGLYLVDKDITLTPVKLKATLRTCGITTIWMTAPLFNRMVDADIEIFAGLRNLLVGGDIVSPLHINRVKQRFPDLRIINGYGPTENTTFSTTYSLEREHDGNIPIGKPIANSTAYIVDKYGGLVPIGVEGELVVGGNGVARGYLNNPEMTWEKFILAHSSWLIADRKVIKRDDRFPMNYELSAISYIYKTGDLARWLPEGNIEFIGRIDHQVKIRGFRIELGEIENHLLKNNEIKRAVVTVLQEKNREKYLCAYVIARHKVQTAKQLRTYLEKKLPEYMIPAFFIYLDTIPLTPNGKVNRKALPKPEIAAQRYTAPANRIEKKLVWIWSEILALEDSLIGVDADFFELGGHSLKAIGLVSKIHEEFNVKVPVAEVFKKPFIRKLSQYIIQAAPNRYIPLAAVEKKEYYPLSAAQKRLYVQQQIASESTNYNIPVMVRVEGTPGKNKLENAFNGLIRRHEILRTSFQMQQKMPVQHIEDEIEFEIEYDWSVVSGHQSLVNCQGRGEVSSPIKVEKIVRDFIRPFDLSKAPLLRVGIIKTGENKHILMTDIHHIISDGTSVGILVNELLLLYEERELCCWQFQYKDFSAWQQRLYESSEIKKQEQYWLDIFAGDIPILDLPTDFPRPQVQQFRGNTIPFEINKELTAEIKQLVSNTKATLFMVLLAIFNITLTKYTGQEDIVVGTPISGRNHAGLEQIIGMFVNMLALRNRPGSNQTFMEFLLEVKHNVLEAFENQDYPFDELVSKLNIQGASNRNPLFDTAVALQNIDTLQVKGVAPPTDYGSCNENNGSHYSNIDNRGAKEHRQLKVFPYQYERTTAKFDLLLVAVEADAVISMSMEYSTELFTPLTIEKITTYYLEILAQVVKDTDIKIKDITLSHHFQEIKSPELKESRHEFKF